MNWTYIKEKNEWQFTADDTIIARIIIKTKDNNPVNKIIVKVLYASFIMGKQKLKRMKKKNRNWFCEVKKKFKESREVEQYIEIKKSIIEKKWSRGLY